MFRNLTPEEYPWILELDKKVYPTNSPVTLENLADKITIEEMHLHNLARVLNSIYGNVFVLGYSG